MLDDVYRWQGLPVIESYFAEETVQVERSWRERLFSLPWRPFRKYREHTQPAAFVLDDEAFGKCLICHPVVKRQLIAAIEEINSVG